MLKSSNLIQIKWVNLLTLAGSMATDIAAPRQVNGRKYSQTLTLKNRRAQGPRGKPSPSSGLVSDWPSHPPGENLTFLRSPFQNVQEAARFPKTGLCGLTALENIKEKTWDPGHFRDHHLCVSPPSLLKEGLGS